MLSHPANTGTRSSLRLRYWDQRCSLKIKRFPGCTGTERIAQNRPGTLSWTLGDHAWECRASGRSSNEPHKHARTHFVQRSSLLKTRSSNPIALLPLNTFIAAAKLRFRLISLFWFVYRSKDVSYLNRITVENNASRNKDGSLRRLCQLRLNR